MDLHKEATIMENKLILLIELQLLRIIAVLIENELFLLDQIKKEHELLFPST